ncbi:MAG: hypothetical protein A2Z24_00325 [Candidatus Woykebacteria bacterium RBG_16_44_10]|uniref:DUF4367 domain-containing protein n=1 Tax=Candidatus Woykebacteria bacterium RBG_16_44_10 TaxID=1802597 RepID=A0A1G1WFH1_9BACT|nr:MAG: hypothetical protein A2Z24_00325 [Candidatus Woykebacteria bacterium RBG_16_44_10]
MMAGFVLALIITAIFCYLLYIFLSSSLVKHGILAIDYRNDPANLQNLLELLGIFFLFSLISLGVSWFILKLFLDTRLAIILTVIAFSSFYGILFGVIFINQMRQNWKETEKKQAIGPVSEKQESLDKLCFKVYLPSYTNESLNGPTVTGYDRFKPCSTQYVLIDYSNSKGREVLIKETKSNNTSLVAIGEQAKTQTIGGYDVKIIERKTSYSPDETVYRLIIDGTRVELTWTKNSRAVLNESDIEEIVESMR